MSSIKLVIDRKLKTEFEENGFVEIEDSVVKSRDEKRIADSEIGEFNED